MIYIFCLYFVLIKIDFLSRDRFYILSIKAHVIFLTPASNSRRRAFARNAEIFLRFFQVVASLSTKACLLNCFIYSVESVKLNHE